MSDEEVICSFEEMLGRADIDAWVDTTAYEARLMLQRLTDRDSTMPPPMTRREAMAFITASVQGAQRPGDAEADDEA